MTKAGLLHQIFATAGDGLPLRAQKNEKKFKLMFLDIGLLQSAMGVDLSVLSAEDRELRDIKPPQDIPFNLAKWLKYGLITLVILLSTFFIIYYIKQRRKGIPLFRKEKIRPAHEIAFEELAALKGKWQDMLNNGQFKTLFTEISEILRKYLENRFFIKKWQKIPPQPSMS